MLWIEQIVSNIEIVAFDIHGVAAVSAPGRVAPLRDRKDFRGVRTLRIAHPDPVHGVPRDHRVGLYSCAAWDPVRAWRAATLAQRVEGEPVIAALEPVAMNTPARQRQLAVWAGILQGRRRSVCLTVQHDRL